MKIKLFIPVILLLILVLSGCAFGIAGAAINGTRQNVFIDTKPRGATVTIEGQVAKTPCQFNLKRKRNYVAVIEKEGYEDGIAYINKEADPLVLYLDGFLLPYIFGTAHDLEPERTYIKLDKLEKKEE